MNGYRDLIVWQKAMKLVKEVYSLINVLPKEEMYALSSQMRRSVVSIPSNIAEGQGRKSSKDFINFLTIARGSKYELETQIYICIEIGYFSENTASYALGLCDEIGKMINSMICKLSTKI